MANGRIDPTAGPGAYQMDPLERLLQLGTLGKKDEALQQQIARAVALQKGSGNRYSTWAGALAGGLGDIVGSVKGNLDEKRLRGEQEANWGDIDKGRGAFAKIPGLRNYLAQAFGLPGGEEDGGGEFGSGVAPAQAQSGLTMAEVVPATPMAAPVMAAPIPGSRPPPTPVGEPPMRMPEMTITGDPMQAELEPQTNFQKLMSDQMTRANLLQMPKARPAIEAWDAYQAAPDAQVGDAYERWRRAVREFPIDLRRGWR